MKILIVEDFEDTRYMIKVWLEMKGHSVVEAIDGRQAITLSLQERPDLILMDLNMPDVDGFAATQKILEQVETGRIPIVAVSAHLGREWQDRALAVGCVDFISKPVDFKRLEALLKQPFETGSSSDLATRITPR
jgi:two-component system, cell cycle response regulator DivK